MSFDGAGVEEDAVGSPENLDSPRQGTPPPEEPQGLPVFEVDLPEGHSVDPSHEAAEESRTLEASHLTGVLENHSRPMTPAPSDPHTGEDASSSVVGGRGKDFVSYNPWIHDVSMLAQLDATPPPPLDSEQTREQELRHEYEKETNAMLKCTDVIGYNYKSNMKTMLGTSVVAHADDDCIIYAAGRHFTMTHITDPSIRKILWRSDSCLVVNCFTASTEGKYIAVSERHADGRFVCIYKMDSTSQIASIDLKYLCKTQVIALSLSSNNRFLATVSADPDAKLLLWQLDDVKVIGIAELPKGIIVVRINPWDSMQVAAVGRSHFIQWKLVDRTLVRSDPLIEAKRSILGGRHPSSIVTCCWYDEDSVAGLSSDGLLIAIENGEVRCVRQLESPPTDSPVKYSNMEWISRGLVVGGTGILLLLDRTYDEESFIPVAVMRLSADIRSISVSPAELNIVLAMKDNSVQYLKIESFNDAIEQAEKQVSKKAMGAKPLRSRGRERERSAAVDFPAPSVQRSSSTTVLHRNATKGSNSSLDLGTTSAGPAPRMMRSLSVVRSPTQVKSYGSIVPTSLLMPIPHISFHSNTITSLSVAIQKPLILTTSLDCTVRLYDFEKRQVILTTKMEDPVKCGAIHPMGLHFIVAFEYYVQIFAILPKEVFPLADIQIRDVHGLRISRYGARVAFAVQSRVFVYDFYSHRQVGALIGHTSMVKSISWSHADTRITTSDANGVISCWNAGTFTRDEMESPHKSLILQSAQYHEKSGLFYAVGSRKHVSGRIFEGEMTILSTAPDDESTAVYVRPGLVLPRAQAMRKMHTTLFVITQLSRSLIVGTVPGRLLLYSLPLLPTSSPYAMVNCQCSEILQMLLSPDDRFLFTVCADGIMYIFSVEQLQEGKAVTLHTSETHLFDDVRYTHSSEIGDLDREIDTLKQRNSELSAQNQRTFEFYLREHNHFIAELARQTREEAEQLRNGIDRMMKAKDDAINRAAKQAAEAEAAHIHAQEDIEKVYDSHIETRMKELQALSMQRDSLVVAYENQIQERAEAMAEEKHQIEHQRREMEKRYEVELDKVRRQVFERFKMNDALVCQTVIDFEEIIRTSEKKYEHSLKAKEEGLQKATTSSMFGDREAERLRREIAACRTQLETREKAVRELQLQADRRAKEGESLKREMLLRQEAINVVEKKMQQLKTKLNLLENVRFVLTHQFDHLRSEVVPKDVKVRNLNLQISDQEEHLGIVSLDAIRMKNTLAAVNKQLESMQKESKKLQFERQVATRRVDVLLCDLSRCVEDYKGNDKRLIARLKGTTKRAKTKFSMEEKEVDPETEATQEELDRHESYLAAKRQAAILHAKETSIRNPKEILGPNNDLLKEINILRGSQRQLLTRFNLAESELRDVRVALFKIATRTTPAIADRPFRDRRGLPQTPEPCASASPIAEQDSLRATTPPRSLPAVSSKPDTPYSQGVDSVSSAKIIPGVRTASSRTLSFRREQATHLQRMVDQLDDNTKQLRGQQKEVMLLRSYVQKLLESEEKRLMLQLRSMSPIGETPGPVGESRSDTAATDLESPDWTTKFQPIGRPVLSGDAPLGPPSPVPFSKEHVPDAAMPFVDEVSADVIPDGAENVRPMSPIPNPLCHSELAAPRAPTPPPPAAKEEEP